MNFIVALGQDLFARARGGKLEASAAGATHAERVPAELPLERVILFEENYQHLVRAPRVARAPRGGDDAVGVLAIGNDRS